MLLNIRAVIVAMVTAPFSLLPLSLHAQMVQTAQQRVRMHVYGLFSNTRPDYGTSTSSSGITAGGTIDGIRVLPYTDVGLELRGAMARSYDIDESSLAGGPRISFSRYRVQPYAEYMLGVGKGSFNHSLFVDYQRDYSAIRSYGGGVNYRLTEYFDLQADVQRQRWRFSYLSPYFHPVQVSVGVNYRLHFRSRTGPR